MQPGYNPQGYPFPPQQPPVQEQNTFQPVAPYGPSPEAPTWGYQSAQQYSPAVQSLTRTDSSPTQDTAEVTYNSSNPTPVDGGWTPPRDGDGEMTYHTWPGTERFPPLDTSPSTIDATLRNPPVQSSPGGTSWPAGVDHYAQARYNTYNPPQLAGQGPQPPQSQPQIDTSIYASASYAQHQQEQQAQAQYNQGKTFPQESTPPSTIPPLPRHTYTRTLVGPLSANACRLLDEHRKPGIFFLFQDLSIRTEGALLHYNHLLHSHSRSPTSICRKPYCGHALTCPFPVN